MLTAISSTFLGLTLIAEFAIFWFGVAFIVIDSWPIRAICTKVPSVISPFSFPISTSHFPPPSISILAPCRTLSLILLRYMNIVNRLNRIYVHGVCGKIIAWLWQPLSLALLPWWWLS